MYNRTGLLHRVQLLGFPTRTAEDREAGCRDRSR